MGGFFGGRLCGWEGRNEENKYLGENRKWKW